MKNELVSEWVKKAEEDYAAASELLPKKGKKFHNVICFHCQQAAEKYFKAFLILHRIDFPKTHDLGLLLKPCIKMDPAFELIMDLARLLNPFSVDLRYPGDKATRADAKKSFKAALEIKNFITPKLRK